jgi:hypothetical protein
MAVCHPVALLAERDQVVQVVGRLPINRLLTDIGKPGYFALVMDVNAQPPTWPLLALMPALLAGVIIPDKCLMALTGPIGSVA